MYNNIYLGYNISELLQILYFCKKNETWSRDNCMLSSTCESRFFWREGFTIKKDSISVKSSTKKDRYKRSTKSAPIVISDNLDRLRAAIVIIPIILVLAVAAVVFFSIKQVTSGFSAAEASDDTTQSSALSASDTKKLLTVVTPDSPLPSGYKLNLVEVEGITVDKACSEGLKELVAAAKKAKSDLVPVKGYVSTAEQNELYNAELQRLKKSGEYSDREATEKAERVVPRGNCADTQTGLSVRFSSSSEKDFQSSKEYIWLLKNSYKYGFIIRYPENKEDETGMSFDPALFRYVGVENATQMTTLNMSLDYYTSYLSSQSGAVPALSNRAL